jgi:hypothetical protein
MGAGWQVFGFLVISAGSPSTYTGDALKINNSKSTVIQAYTTDLFSGQGAAISTHASATYTVIWAADGQGNNDTQVESKTFFATGPTNASNGYNWSNARTLKWGFVRGGSNELNLYDQASADADKHRLRFLTQAATDITAKGTGAIELNKLPNSGTGGVVFGSGGASPTTVGTVDSGGVASMRRFKAGNGTPLVAGDFALSGGWGTTASVGSVRGTDQFFEFVVTSTGTGQGASPTITYTPKDGTWTTAPVWICQRQDFGSQATVTFTHTTQTATSLVLTFNGTPSAAETFKVACHTGGI